MTDQIISRETIRQRTRAAFAAGRSRDDHDMNWHADARLTWQLEYDHLDEMAAVDKRHERRSA